ncbi:hypothetical protein MTO96_005775 [Rhipicephalus appendiculatus]
MAANKMRQPPSEGEVAPEFSRPRPELEGQTESDQPGQGAGKSSSHDSKSDKGSAKADDNGPSSTNAPQIVQSDTKGSSSSSSSTSTATSEKYKRRKSRRKHRHRDSGPCSCPMYEVEVIKTAGAEALRGKQGTSDRAPSPGMQVVTTETVTKRLYTYNMDIDLPEGVRISPRGKLVEDQGVSAENDPTSPAKGPERHRLATRGGATKITSRVMIRGPRIVTSQSESISSSSSSTSTTTRKKHKRRKHRHRDSGPCCCPMYEVEVIKTAGVEALRGQQRPLPGSQPGMQAVNTETVAQRLCTYNMGTALPVGMQISPRGKLVENQGVMAVNGAYDNMQPYGTQPTSQSPYGQAYSQPQRPQLTYPPQNQIGAPPEYCMQIQQQQISTNGGRTAIVKVSSYEMLPRREASPPLMSQNFGGQMQMIRPPPKGGLTRLSVFVRT